MIVASIPSTLDIEKSQDANITFSLNTQSIETTTTDINDITSSINTTLNTSVDTTNINSINVLTEEKRVSLNTSATSNYYNSLFNKPSINGVTLVGNLTSADLGIIDDENISDGATYSSAMIQKQLQKTAVVKELIGTKENPIIAADLELSGYILSGVVQSSQKNPTTYNVPRKHYIVNKDVDNITILWDCNPYTTTQYYIAFYNDNAFSPFEKTIELVTKEDLKIASFDCGEF